MKERALPTAWMIREDGAEIPCVQHIYGNGDDIEETLYASQWLYEHTGRELTRQLVLRFISSYGTMLGTGHSPLENILCEMREKPYIVLTEDFLHEIGERLSPVTEDIRELNLEVCTALNREFLRARLGGKYNTVHGCRDIYFRISFPGIDWSGVITEFLENHAERIDTVTVIYDEESIGKADILKNTAGEVLDHMAFYRGDSIRIMRGEDDND